MFLLDKRNGQVDRQADSQSDRQTDRQIDTPQVRYQ